MIKAVFYKDTKTSFKCLQYHPKDMRAVLGEKLGNQCVDFLREKRDDSVVCSLERRGFNIRVDPLNDSRFNGYNLVDYFEPRIGKRGIRFDIISGNGDSIIPGHQVVTYYPEQINDKWQVIKKRLETHVDEFSKLNEYIRPVERGLTSRTYFPDLGYYAEKEFPIIKEAEFKQAQLDKLGNLICASRKDRYWEITIAKGDNIPIHVAERINRYYSNTIRIDGMPGGISPERLKESFHNQFGVRMWHVDTIEALSELSASLRDYYMIDVPIISEDKIYDYLANLVNGIKNRNHDKRLH